jgi:hypothetical protein
MTDSVDDYLYPFRNIDDVEFLDDDNVGEVCEYNLYSKYEHLNFANFDHTEHKMYEVCNEIDPENHFYNNINNNCEYYSDEQFKSVRRGTTFSIIHFNSRSLYKNFTKIKDYLCQFNKFNVIAVSETWLDNEKGHNVEMEGYELFTSNRTNKKGGGVALYVDTALRCTMLKSMTINIDDILESLTIEITVEKSKNIIISCVYRTPGSCLDTFTCKSEAMFANLNHNKVHIICGDFNIDLLNPHGNNNTIDFINTMYSNSLFPLITKPSRITKDTATLIDNIFINTIASQVTAGLLINDISDHLPVFAIFKNLLEVENIKKNHTHQLTRCRSPEAIAALRMDLSTQTWNQVYATEDPNQAYEAFLSTILKLYDKHCPIRKTATRKKYRHDKPWITKGIENACKKKNLLYRLFLKQRTKDAENRYKTYKNKLIRIIRFNKKEYYHRLLEQQRSNIQGTWKILNSIIKKGTGKKDYPMYFTKENIIMDKSKEIANEFNNFFVKVGSNLATEILEQRDKEGLDVNNIIRNPNSIFIGNVNENEILDIVNKFKNKKSTDFANLDMMLVKNIVDCIVTPFTYICNQSFLTGIFPNTMKTAKVIPIFKSGDSHQFTNYRPISLLSQFSKILEKLFVERLDNFIEKHHLLSDHQYGFRCNMSTSMAVMELVEGISTAIDNREYTVGVFIDLKKAFDTIDHGILLEKMERYGVRGIAHNWLKSYLDDRDQYVHMYNVDSDLQKVTHGVPQGSVLGPKLFIMYINDLCDVSKLLKCVLFADDTSLYCSGKDIEQLLDKVENELTILKKWFDINKLSLNLKKTKFIIFGNKKINEQAKLKINDVEIERVNENTFLGTIIDNKLNWKPQINNIKSKISKTIAILYKIKNILNQNSLYILYCSLILPYITYCVEVWGNAYKTNINQIFLLQKKAIRIINHANYCATTNPLFIKLHALKFEDLAVLRTAVVMYKAHHRTLPHCIQELFGARDGHYQLRGAHMFRSAGARTDTKSRCISVKGINIWNKLDCELKTCNSIKKFKRNFKTKVIERYKASL